MRLDVIIFALGYFLGMLTCFMVRLFRGEAKNKITLAQAGSGMILFIYCLARLRWLQDPLSFEFPLVLDGFVGGIIGVLSQNPKEMIEKILNGKDKKDVKIKN